MKSKHKILQINTSKNQEFIEITYQVSRYITDQNLMEGFVSVYCPHTTAGITINENADQDVLIDIIAGLNRVIPVVGQYRHFEGNSHAHIKSSLMGVEKTIPVSDGKMLLGTWQGIYFCEFDGPRNRQVILKLHRTEE
jgi:secondary thiamine-phosphate synthase enzyme